MNKLYFEELEKVESLDAKGLGTFFGIIFVATILVYVGIAT